MQCSWLKRRGSAIFALEREDRHAVEPRPCFALIT